MLNTSSRNGSDVLGLENKDVCRGGGVFVAVHSRVLTLVGHLRVLRKTVACNRDLRMDGETTVASRDRCLATLTIGNPEMRDASAAGEENEIISTTLLRRTTTLTDV